jgi:hypothetical protein
LRAHRPKHVVHIVGAGDITLVVGIIWHMMLHVCVSEY